MQLITIAHRKEAQFFLQNGFRPAPYDFEGLYRSSKDLLLLTGEGIFPAISKVSAVCTSFRKELKGILNYGVAGGLCNNTGLFQVRLNLLESQGDIQYHTHPCQILDKTPLADCLTSFQRVLDSDLASKLSLLAPLVDRELWGIGHVAKTLKLPLSSFKYISDQPVLNEQACAEVLKKSPYFSEQLFKHYQTLSFDSKIEKKTQCSWPLTTTQKRLLNKLLKHLSLQNQKDPEEILKEAMEVVPKNLKDKRRTQYLLNYLQNEQSPFRAHFEKKLLEYTRPFSQKNWKASFSRDLESPDLHLSGTLKNQEDLENFKDLLENLDFTSLDALYRGEEGV